MVDPELFSEVEFRLMEGDRKDTRGDLARPGCSVSGQMG